LSKSVYLFLHNKLQPWTNYRRRVRNGRAKIAAGLDGSAAVGLRSAAGQVGSLSAGGKIRSLL
jgi:hypothetical protein